MKKPWLLVAANVIVALLVILFLIAILSALAAFAAYVTTWPLLVLLGCGVLLSLLTVGAMKKVEGHRARLLGNLLNGSALMLYTSLIVAISWMFLSATTERFVLPQGYQGEVYVVHGVPGGVAEERSFYRIRTYHIPNDGVLLTQVPLDTGRTRSEYRYQAKDGKLTKIRNEWYSTIQSTPDNLANTKDVGMYFPRTASGSDNSGCTGPSDLFEIGTPSYLLSKHTRIDLSAYLARHAATCVKH
jgi:hypothetical protein